jgi:hypothetical protein
VVPVTVATTTGIKVDVEVILQYTRLLALINFRGRSDPNPPDVSPTPIYCCLSASILLFKDEDVDGSNGSSVMSGSPPHGSAGMDARRSGRGYRDVGSRMNSGLEDEDYGSSSRRATSDTSYYGAAIMEGRRSGRGYSDDSRGNEVEEEEDGSSRRSASDRSYYGSASMDVHRSGRGYSDDSATNRDSSRRNYGDSSSFRERDRTTMDRTRSKSSRSERDYSEEPDREREDGSRRYRDRSDRWTCEEVCFFNSYVVFSCKAKFIFMKRRTNRPRLR